MVLFCHNTSKVEDEPYPELLSEKGGMGFPFLVFLDAEGDVITTHNKARTLKGFQETLGSVNDLLRLEELAKKGDKSADTPLFIAKVKLGRYNFAEASAKRKKLPGESVAQKKEIDQLMIGLEAEAIFKEINFRSRESVVAAGEKLMAMKKAGRIPEGGAGGNFWAVILTYAESKEDLALMEKAFENVKSSVGDQINKRWVGATERRIKRLKEKVKDKEEKKKQEQEEGSGKDK